MLIRIVSGLIGIGLFLGLCFAGLAPFTIAVAVLAALAAAEYTRGQMRIATPEGVPPSLSAPSIKTLLSLLNPTLVSISLATVPLAYSIARLPALQFAELFDVLLLLGVMAGVLLVVKAWKTAVILGRFRVLYGKVGFWYISTFSSFVLLRSLPGRVRLSGMGEADKGAWIMLFVACCVWATDTFAYFVGRACGKHKFSPALSPKKTVEGFIGGLVGAIVVGAVFGHWLSYSWLQGAIVGAIAGSLGPLGDLFESGLKRELGIKDFGNIMPGHGGALDRFDSLMFVAPAAYLFLFVGVH